MLPFRRSNQLSILVGSFLKKEHEPSWNRECSRHTHFISTLRDCIHIFFFQICKVGKYCLLAYNIVNINRNHKYEICANSPAHFHYVKNSTFFLFCFAFWFFDKKAWCLLVQHENVDELPSFNFSGKHLL